MTFELYRQYDADGVLLYVGMSISTMTRLRGHKSTSHWFKSVVFIALERFETLEECAEAEKQAIRNEHPLFNQKCVSSKHNRKTPDGYMCKRTLAEHIGISVPTLNKWISNGVFTVPAVRDRKPQVWCENEVKSVFQKSPTKENRQPKQKTPVEFEPSVQIGASSMCALKVARHLGVSRKTFYNMLEDGRFSVPCIPGIKPRRRRIADVEAVWGPRV